MKDYVLHEISTSKEHYGMREMKFFMVLEFEKGILLYICKHE